MGWTFVCKVLKPIKIGMQLAAKSVLKFFCYKCKSTSKNACSKILCFGRRHGLKLRVTTADVNRVEFCGYH